MGHRVRLIIPTDNEQEIGPIIGRIIGRWGGLTVTSGVGWWRGNNGWVRNKLSVLECSIGLWDQTTREWWYDLAKIVRIEWSQDCVFLSVAEEHAKLIGPGGMVRVIGREDDDAST